MAEKRNVHVKVTSNVNSVLNKMGDTAGKQGNKTSGALGRIKGLFSGIASSAGAATGGIRAMTMSLIVRAMDSEGKAIWNPKELSEVMREVDNTVINEIVSIITKDEPTVEEAKKS